MHTFGYKDSATRFIGKYVLLAFHAKPFGFRSSSSVVVDELGSDNRVTHRTSSFVDGGIRRVRRITADVRSFIEISQANLSGLELENNVK